uniref:Nucleolar protein 11 n=1 Tax=Cyclopterus lumpus TaxID=8103 RepID=A0A8C3B4B0_CYCLU
MAALYEGYTLCGLAPAQNQSNSGVLGVEAERDSDHVVVTDSTRSVTLYKVSDQKPLSSWTVKQGQTLTCSAVYNPQTKEYVAVSDGKVIRIWKQEHLLLDQAFKATVSADVWRVHCVAGGEPVVLFKRGAVRLLDALLSAPQQPIEEVLAQEESIRSVSLTAPVYFKLHIVLYMQNICYSFLNHFLCVSFHPDPNGHVYQSVVSERGLVTDEGGQAFPLPRSLLLSLPVGEGLLEAASAQALDEAHIAVVGVPHPSAGSGKGKCVLITPSRALLWSFWNKLFIPHGKTLSVIPYECPKSSLASALGKMRQVKTEGELEQICSTTAPVEEVQREVDLLLSRTDIQDLQPSLGQLASTLVSRTLQDPAFYTPSSLAQLVHTRCLCHSVCPDLVLLALERKDYFLCQLCLQFFPDIPEAITCACLKAFISMSDVDAENGSLEPDGVSFMETLIARERGPDGLLNGFSPTSAAEYRSDGLGGGGTRAQQDEEMTSPPPEQICPVGLHKAVLLNEVLQTAYSDSFLLPHLKDLSSQQVVLFLQYLQFLYLKYSQDAFPQTHGLRSPSLSQILDWVCVLLDAHFTVLVMTPEAKGLLVNLHSFVKSQVRLVSELGKIEGSLQELNKMTAKKDVGQYSIEIIELF